MRLCKKKQPTHELNEDIKSFICAEPTVDDLQVEEVVYRNASVYGIVGNWRLGHKRMTWRDADRNFCAATFAPRCQGIVRKKDHWEGWR